MAVEIRKPHKHVQPGAQGGSHQPYAWWHADEAARLAQTLLALDVRRQSLQLDTGDVWEVVTTSPASWRRVARPSALERLELGPATTPVHVYVAPSGSDAAAGTLAAPKATLAGAWALVPAVQTAPIVVHLASGSHEWTQPPATLQRATSIFVVGDGAGQPGDDGFEVLASGTVASASTGATITVAGSMTAGAFTGCTIEMLTGAAAGHRRGISDNGASTVRVAVGMTIGVGDAYRIVRPSVVINKPADQAAIWIPNGVRVSLVNVAMNAQTTVWSDGCALWGVEARGGNVVLQSGVKLFAGVLVPDSTAMLVSVLGVAAVGAWQGWGLLCRTTYGYAGGNGRTDDMVEGYVYLADFMLQAGGNLSGGRLGGVSLSGTTRLRLGGAFLISGSARPIYLQGRATLTANILEAVDSRSTPATTSLLMQEIAEMNCAQLTLTAPSLPAGSVPVDMSGQCRLNASIFTISSPVAGGIRLSDSTSVWFTSLTMTGAIQMYSCSKLSGQVLNCGPLLCYGSAEVSIGNAGTTCSALITGSMPGGGALNIDGNARVSFGWNGGGYGAISIMNIATAASSDGIRVRGGGSLFCVVAPTVSTAGSSGFGINARGGGRVLLPSTANVSGVTADCTVGTAAGDDFSKSDLATALSGRVSGVSAIQRHQ